MSENENGSVNVEPVEENESTVKGTQIRQDETLYGLLHRMIATIFFPDPDNTGSRDATLLHRIKTSLADNTPYLSEASRNTARNVILWTRRGSSLRVLLVISVSFSPSIFCFNFLIV